MVMWESVDNDYPARKNAATMLEAIDLTQKIDETEYRSRKTALQMELKQMQRHIKGERLPMAIIIEGIDTAGKGAVIERLVDSMDPRWFSVIPYREADPWEKSLPLLYRFWVNTPPKGKIHIYDRSWYYELLMKRLKKIIKAADFFEYLNDAVSFEKTLVQNGTFVVKFWLHISKAEQKKRLKLLEKQPDLAWQAGKKQWKLHKKYDKIMLLAEELLSHTDSEISPWNIVAANDLRYARITVMNRLVETMEMILGKTFRERAMAVLQAEHLSQLSLG